MTWLVTLIVLLISFCTNFAFPTSANDYNANSKTLNFGKNKLCITKDIGKITDIKLTNNNAIVVSGEKGAIELNENKVIKNTSFAKEGYWYNAIISNNDINYYNSGGAWSNAIILNSDGKLVWEQPSNISPNAIIPILTNNIMSYIIGYNANGGISKISSIGKLEWNHADSNVWSVELIDSDGDGTPEIFHTNALGIIVVRDLSGNIIKRVKLPIYATLLSRVDWPQNAKKQNLIVTENNMIYIIDSFSFKKLFEIKLDVSKLARITSTTIDYYNNKLLCILVNSLKESALYIYNDKYKLVFKEKFPFDKVTIFIPKNNLFHKVNFILGYSDTVWSYSLEETNKE